MSPTTRAVLKGAALTIFYYVLILLLMYMTPVIYPMTIVPERYRWMVRFNPVRSILEVFRDPIYFSKIPPLEHLAVAGGVAVLAFVIGYWIIPSFLQPST